MTTIATEAAFNAYGAAWSARNIAAIMAFFTEDCVYEDVPLGRVNRGQDEIRAFLEETFRSFPDFTIEPTSALLAGDRANLEWVMSGTHQGDLPGLPATGKQFAIRGASIIELQGGKIKRNTDYWDQLTLLQQLGAIPAPEQAAS